MVHIEAKQPHVISSELDARGHPIRPTKSSIYVQEMISSTFQRWIHTGFTVSIIITSRYPIITSRYQLCSRGSESRRKGPPVLHNVVKADSRYTSNFHHSYGWTATTTWTRNSLITYHHIITHSPYNTLNQCNTYTTWQYISATGEISEKEKVQIFIISHTNSLEV